MKKIIISNPKTISKTAASSKQSAKKQTSTSKRTSTSKKPTIKGRRVRRLIAAGRDIDDMEKLRGLSAASATCLDTADFLAADLEDAPLVEGFFNKGEVVALVGSPKSGKALLAAQAHVCVGAGVPFVGHEVSRARSCYVSGECNAATLKRRMLGVCRALRVDPEALRGNVCLDATQGGVGLADVLATCRAKKCEVAIIDPLYSVAPIDETDAAECRELADTLRQFKREGITLIVVCHFPKVEANCRPYPYALPDMVSRSPIIARVFESVVGVMPSMTDENARVICAVTRNFSPCAPFAVKVEDGAFKCAPEVPLFPLSRREKIEAERRRRREESRARLEALRNVKRNGNAE